MLEVCVDSFESSANAVSGGKISMKCTVCAEKIVKFKIF